MNTKGWDWLDWSAFISLIVGAVMLCGWLGWIFIDSNIEPLFYSVPEEIIKERLNVSCSDPIFVESENSYYCDIDNIIVS